MNKEELEQKISSMEKELSNLKEQIKLCKGDKIWEPKTGEDFWVIANDGFAINTKDYVCFRKGYIEQGNHFQTKEEAEKQAEYNKVMNRFRKYVEAYSEPLDWEERRQPKIYMYYDRDDKRIVYNGTYWKFDYAFQIYASSVQILRDAVIYSAGSTKEFIRIVFNKGEK